MVLTQSFIANNSVQPAVDIDDAYIVSDSPCGRVICQRLARPARIFSNKQLFLVTSKFLEPSRGKRKASSRGTMYKVERVIARRTVDG